MTQVAAGTELPPDSHVIRRAKNADALPNSPPTAAFRLKVDKGEKEISVRWLEYFADLPAPEQMKAACHCLHAAMDLRDNDRILTVDVDRARLWLVGSVATVTIVYSPDPNFPDDVCHASVEGVAALEEERQLRVAQILALAVTENRQCSVLRTEGVLPARQRR